MSAARATSSLTMVHAGAAANPPPMRALLLLWLASIPAVSASCNQQNKQKAVYAYFEHEPPLSEVPALDMIGDIVVGELDSLEAYGNRGIYSAFMLNWNEPSPGGYMGPQVTAKRLISGADQQVLFSLWDQDPGEDTWLPAIPDQENCKRNCNDCAVHTGEVHDDGSTGTQCKVFIPRYANQELRMRVRRVEAEGSREMYGRTWTGGVWEVTVQDLGTGDVWTVGRQLLAEQTGGIIRTSAFNEHIGCTPCDAFDQSEVRRGPWVLEPNGTTLVGATSRYTKTREDGFTCHRHAITSDAFGAVTFASGPSSDEQPGSGAWDKTLYSCDGAGGCATPTPPPPPSPPPPAAASPSPPPTPVYRYSVTGTSAAAAIDGDALLSTIAALIGVPAESVQLEAQSVDATGVPTIRFAVDASATTQTEAEVAAEIARSDAVALVVVAAPPSAPPPPSPLPPPEGLTGGALAAVIAAPIAACCLVVVAVGLVYFLRLRKKGVKSEMRVADV